MTLLACNYSPQLMSLLEDDRVAIDYIKMGRWSVFWEELEAARRAKPWPILLHCLPHAGKPSFAEIEWNELNKAIRVCGSPHIALHLAAMPTDWEQAPVSDEIIVDRMIAGVMLWKEQMTVDLLVENVPFYGFRGTLRCSTDPEIITRICQQCDVGLLLDLAHLRVAAWHRKETTSEYLQKLPLDRVKEIHVCGPVMDPVEGLRDRHLEMQEVDYELLAEALQVTNPAFVSLEYGGTGPHMEWRSEIDVLERQLTRLRTIV
jgi:uncharacterized protein (UPF0276 family)